MHVLIRRILVVRGLPHINSWQVGTPRSPRTETIVLPCCKDKQSRNHWVSTGHALCTGPGEMYSESTRALKNRRSGNLTLSLLVWRISSLLLIALLIAASMQIALRVNTLWDHVQPSGPAVDSHPAVADPGPAGSFAAVVPGLAGSDPMIQLTC